MFNFDIVLSCHDLVDVAAGRSCEKRGTLDESIESTQGPSKGAQAPHLASSPTRNTVAVELTESSTGLQNPKESEKPAEEKAEDTAQKLGRTCLMTLYLYCLLCPVLISNSFIDLKEALQRENTTEVWTAEGIETN